MMDWIQGVILFLGGMAWGAALYLFASYREHNKMMKQLQMFQRLSDSIASERQHQETERARQEYRDQSLQAWKDP